MSGSSRDHRWTINSGCCAACRTRSVVLPMTQSCGPPSPWVAIAITWQPALDVGGASTRFVKEVIERQRTVPPQGLTQGHEVVPHHWVIHPRPCGVSTAYTHSPRLCAVYGQEVARTIMPARQVHSPVARSWPLPYRDTVSRSL